MMRRSRRWTPDRSSDRLPGPRTAELSCGSCSSPAPSDRAFAGRAIATLRLATFGAMLVSALAGGFPAPGERAPSGR